MVPCSSKVTKHDSSMKDPLTNKWVVNLSAQVLTELEEWVLRQNLNFSPAPGRIPVMDIAAEVESVARKMEKRQLTTCGAVFAVY